MTLIAEPIGVLYPSQFRYQHYLAYLEPLSLFYLQPDSRIKPQLDPFADFIFLLSHIQDPIQLLPSPH